MRRLTVWGIYAALGAVMLGAQSPQRPEPAASPARDRGVPAG